MVRGRRTGGGDQLKARHERGKIRGEVGAQGAANENQGQLERVKVGGGFNPGRALIYEPGGQTKGETASIQATAELTQSWFIFTAANNNSPLPECF